MDLDTGEQLKTSEIRVLDLLDYATLSCTCLSPQHFLRCWLPFPSGRLLQVHEHQVGNQASFPPCCCSHLPLLAIIGQGSWVSPSICLHAAVRSGIFPYFHDLHHLLSGFLFLQDNFFSGNPSFQHHFAFAEF